ncbi:MAG: hypothetical protein H5T86_01535 [Armatimonadetes bacterium]|nr:hypothetical protein [Armatimonadota bacterium]
MSRVSLSDVLDLLGEGGLAERYEERKARFRAFLQQPKWRPEDIAPWLEECLEYGCAARPVYFYAFQDIVVSIGTHLGLQVEYGQYGQRHETGYDGKWVTADGDVLLLEVKTSPWPVPSVHQLGRYLNAFALRHEMPPERVFGLFLVGPGELAPIVDQIRGSEFRSRMKLLQVFDLLRLWRLKLNLASELGSDAAERMVQRLLLPMESINVGALLDLIEEVARRTAARGAENKPVSSDGKWTRSELLDFMKKASPVQRAVLGALTLEPGKPLRTAELVALMRDISEQWVHMPRPDSVTARTLSGGLASLRRICRERGRESIIEHTSEGYRVAEQYLDWLTEWAQREKERARQCGLQARLLNDSSDIGHRAKS